LNLIHPQLLAFLDTFFCLTALLLLLFIYYLVQQSKPKKSQTGGGFNEDFFVRLLCKIGRVGSEQTFLRSSIIRPDVGQASLFQAHLQANKVLSSFLGKLMQPETKDVPTFSHVVCRRVM